MSLVFRRGRPSRWRDRMVTNQYRNIERPRLVRNGVLVMPFLLIAWFPLFLVAGWLLANIDRGLDWPHWAKSVTVWGLGAYLVISFGLTLLFAHQPPSWFMPRWLKDLNRADSYVPPKADWFDLFIWGLGVLFLAAGLMFIVAGYFGATGTRGL